MKHNAIKIIITGGSGFLGTKISEQLVNKGCEVISLDISPPRVDEKTHTHIGYIQCNLAKDTINPEWFDGVFAVINLAGVPIFGRWTDEKKQHIYDSRVIGTRRLVEVLKKTDVTNFVSASAVGVYGNRGDELLDEKSELGDETKSFLTYVSKDWEHEASQLNQDIQTTIVRNGHVLGEKGLVGVLKPYYQWGVGGPLGSGNQWFPWVHIQDCAKIYTDAALQDVKEDFKKVRIVNAVVGDPITNKTFSQVFAKALQRPHVFFIPKFALKLLYGDFGDEMMYSQKIHQNTQMNFDFRDISDAMKNILD